MDFRGQLRFMENNITERDLVPSWARAEHLERSVPLKELWKYSSSCKAKNGIWKTIISRLKRINHRKEHAGMTNKHNSCHEHKLNRQLEKGV